MIFVNTNAAAAAGLVAALLLSQAWFGKADLTMALNGALAGLVAITAEPLTPSPLVSTIVGAIAGLIVVFSIVFIDKLKIDDTKTIYCINDELLETCELSDAAQAYLSKLLIISN